MSKLDKKLNMYDIIYLKLIENSASLHLKHYDQDLIIPKKNMCVNIH